MLYLTLSKVKLD